MNLKDIKLFVVVFAVLGGLGYVVFFSNWRPTPRYEGAAPSYKPKASGPRDQEWKFEEVDASDPRLQQQHQRMGTGGKGWGWGR